MCTPPGPGNWCSNFPSNRRGRARSDISGSVTGGWICGTDHTDNQISLFWDSPLSIAFPVLWDSVFRAPMVVNAATNPIKHFLTLFKLLSCPSIEFSHLFPTEWAGKTPKGFYNVYKTMIQNWIMLSKSSIFNIVNYFLLCEQSGGGETVQVCTWFRPHLSIIQWRDSEDAWRMLTNDFRITLGKSQGLTNFGLG